MRVPGLNLTTWWARLTRQTVGEPPPLAPSIQPVLVVGDHSWHVGPVAPRQGISGWKTNSIGGFYAIQLVPHTPGGLVIHWFTVGHPGGAGSAEAITYNWTIGNAFAVQPPGAGVHSVNPNRPTLADATTRNNAVAWIGGGGAGHTGDAAAVPASFQIAPTFRLGAAIIPGPIWVPPGRAFILEASGTGQGVSGSAYYTDIEAGEGDA